jgi:hypothetical protein
MLTSDQFYLEVEAADFSEMLITASATRVVITQKCSLE